MQLIFCLSKTSYLKKAKFIIYGAELVMRRTLLHDLMEYRVPFVEVDTFENGGPIQIFFIISCYVTELVLYAVVEIIF